MKTWFRYEDGDKVKYVQDEYGRCFRYRYDNTLLMWTDKSHMSESPEDSEFIDELIRCDEVHLE